MTSAIPTFANTNVNPSAGTSQTTAVGLRDPNATNLDRLRYVVSFLAQAVKGAGGTDYTTDLRGQLRSDTADALSQFLGNDLDAVEVWIWKNVATSQGGTPGTTAAAWAANSIALRDLDEEDLKRMKIFLLNALAVASL